MNEIKIEKGIPPAKETRGRPSKYPFEKMEIGDSIFVEEPGDRTAVARSVAYAKKAIHYVWQCADGEVINPPQEAGPREILAAINHKEGYWKPIGRKHFVSRREAGGVRIWRVDDVLLDERDYYEVPTIPGVKFMRA